jgi:hypothetical protein
MTKPQSQRPVELNTVRARAAVTGHNAGIVLVVSTMAVIICFAVIYFYYFAR